MCIYCMHACINSRTKCQTFFIIPSLIGFWTTFFFCSTVHEILENNWSDNKVCKQSWKQKKKQRQTWGRSLWSYLLLLTWALEFIRGRGRWLFLFGNLPRCFYLFPPPCVCVLVNLFYEAKVQTKCEIFWFVARNVISGTHAHTNEPSSVGDSSGLGVEIIVVFLFEPCGFYACNVVHTSTRIEGKQMKLTFSISLICLQDERDEEVVRVVLCGCPCLWLFMAVCESVDKCTFTLKLCVSGVCVCVCVCGSSGAGFINLGRLLGSAWWKATQSDGPVLLPYPWLACRRDKERKSKFQRNDNQF